MANRKTPDANLALISIILGATSLMYSVFTGIPAIILGIMALRRNVGDRTQAKAGIIMGSVGCLLLIPIILIAVHFLRKPFNQQTGITAADRTEMVAITEALNEYKKAHGMFPACEYNIDVSGCADWQQFVSEHPGLVTHPVEYEESPNRVADRPAGTIVYARMTTCFINVPVDPNYLNSSDSPRKDTTNYAAIVYFHDKGRSCFGTDRAK